MWAASREGAEALTGALYGLQPFELDFSVVRVGSGAAGGNLVDSSHVHRKKDGRHHVCLCPPEAHPCREELRGLTARLADVFPQAEEGQVGAHHITLGQADCLAAASNMVDKIRGCTTSWGLPVRWEVTAVSLLCKNSAGQYREVRSFALDRAVLRDASS